MAPQYAAPDEAEVGKRIKPTSGRRQVQERPGPSRPEEGAGSSLSISSGMPRGAELYGSYAAYHTGGGTVHDGSPPASIRIPTATPLPNLRRDEAAPWQLPPPAAANQQQRRR